MKAFAEVPGRVRQHSKPGLTHQLRAFRESMRLGSLGSGAFIDRNVHLDRYTKKIHIGSDVILKEGARICVAQPSAEIRIGDRTTIGYNTYIFSASSVTIEKNCLIAPFCYLVDNNHQIDRAQLINEQPLKTAPIHIEEDVWIGAHCTVLAGVTIGRGSVIAAGSVVNEDIPPYSVAGGTPAKIIRSR